MSDTHRHRIFVYGTLQTGEPNHHLLHGARRLGPARTEPRFELFDFGDYPALVEGGRVSVHGELYEVDDATLGTLDVLEEVPEYYVRKMIRVVRQDTQQDAATYVLPREHTQGATTIPGGRWTTSR